MPEQEFNVIFSKRLRYYLAKNNLTQVELAKKLGVGNTSVYNWCNGIKTPRMDKVDAMCDLFHCKRSDLIADNSSPILSKDEKDIAKDLQTIMDKLNSDENGPASFEGNDIPEADKELFAGQLELMLRRLKAINKDLYNPNKNKE